MKLKNIIDIIAEKLGLKSKKKPKTIFPPKPRPNPLHNVRPPILPPFIVRGHRPEHKRIARSRLKEIKSIDRERGNRI